MYMHALTASSRKRLQGRVVTLQGRVVTLGATPSQQADLTTMPGTQRRLTYDAPSAPAQPLHLTVTHALTLPLHIT